MSDLELLIRSFHEACLDVAQRRRLGPAPASAPAPAREKPARPKAAPTTPSSRASDASQQALQAQIDELRSQIETQSQAMGSLIETLQVLVGPQGQADADKRMRVVKNE